MKARSAWFCLMIVGLVAPRLFAQTPELSSIEAPYPAVQSSVHIAGGVYGPGSVPYGPVGTPLVLGGSSFGSSGTVVFTSYKNGVAGTSVSATVTSWSESILFLTVPAGATSGLVFVKADGKTSNGLPFMVTPGAYAGTCPSTPPSSELQITTSSLPNGSVGQAYSVTLSATGGTPPYNWSLTGPSLPAGLSLSASSGAITGTPTAATGPVSLTVKAIDSHSQATDAVLDITIQSHTLIAGTVYSYSVPTSGGFDQNGNVRQYIDSIMGTWSFNYDNLNRLSSAIPGAGAPSAYAGQNLCINYDGFGNRTQSDFQTTACNPASDPATAKYSSANQVSWTTVNSASNGFGYDAAGDVSFDGANYYFYDGEGRLCAMQTYPYTGGVLAYGYIYDAEGRRVAKGTISPSGNPRSQPLSCDPKNNGFALTESYVLDSGGAQLTTLDQNGNPVRTNVYGGSRLLATYDTTGLHFHVTDPLGTRRVQTNAQGVPELDCQSLPFGDQQNCFQDPNSEGAGEDATPLHFSGKQRDSESGNDYFGARYYASNMGRFMSPDWTAKPEPVPYSRLDDPQSLNLYGFVANNPLSRVDSDGHLITLAQLHSSCSDCMGEATVDWGMEDASPIDLAQAMANGRAVDASGEGISQAQQQSSNSTTTTVTLNSRQADIPGGGLLHDAGISHEWISTPDGTDVGMGTAKGVPQSDAPGVETQVVDHTGQVPTSTQTFTGVDKAALATYTKIGTPTGRWVPGVNDCNTWAHTAINQSTPHDISVVIYGVPTVIAHNVVVYADGSIHDPGGH